MNPEENKILIVLGMHRSGTSLTANWLSKSGLHIGDRLIGATESNKNGHYEDEDFHSFHEDIFQSYGIPDGALLQTPKLQITSAQTEKLRSLIALKNSQNHSWGWKDPRTCLFTDLYDALVPEADYLVVYRDFNNVVDSLIRREYKEKAVTRPWKKKKGPLKHLLHRLKNPPTTYEAVSKRYLKDFSEAWVQYNEKIIDHINRLPKERFRVIRHPSPDQKMMAVCEWLTCRGFDLTPIPFSQTFDENQMQRTPIKIKVAEEVQRAVMDIEKRLVALANET